MEINTQKKPQQWEASTPLSLMTNTILTYSQSSRLFNGIFIRKTIGIHSGVVGEYEFKSGTSLWNVREIPQCSFL